MFKKETNKQTHKYLRFDIPVQNIFAMQVPNGLAGLAKYSQNLQNYKSKMWLRYRSQMEIC